MDLRYIKTSELINELMNRIGDQLHDPEPVYDELFSHLDENELDWMMGELIEKSQVANERRRIGAKR
jgi:hypothetical protein